MKIGTEAADALISFGFMALRGKRKHISMMLIYNAAKEAELKLKSDVASAVLLAALDSCHISEALVIHDKMEEVKVEFSRKAQFTRCFNSIKFRQVSAEQAVRGVRTRKRSSTCPRMHLTPPEDGGFFDDYL